jgi:uncharacterized protein YcgL (UPF0745 family)
MGKKGKGKGKKGPEDWGARDVEKYVTVEIRNSVWQSMRFTQLLGTSTKLSHLVQVRPAHGRAAQSHFTHSRANALAGPTHPHTLTDIEMLCAQLIMDKHQVSGLHGLYLYLGTEAEWSKQPESLTKAFPTPRQAVAYIMDTFPIVKRKDEARTAEKNAAGEMVKPGRYLTKDTILEIYDALQALIRTGTPTKPASPRPPLTRAAAIRRERPSLHEYPDTQLGAVQKVQIPAQAGISSRG